MCICCKEYIMNSVINEETLIKKKNLTPKITLFGVNNVIFNLNSI